MNEGSEVGRYRKEFRAVLIALGAPLLALGAWAVFAPQSWYDDFPGGGRHWVSALGPYNEHLASDVGSFFLAIGGLLIFAAVVLERRVVQAAFGALLVFSLPHFIYHLTELDAMGTTDNLLSMFSLGLLVAVPAVMLLLTGERTQTQAAAVTPKTKGEVTYGTR